MKHRLHHPVVVTEFMVGVDDQHRVEIVRKMRVSTLSKDRFDLPEFLAVLPLPHFINRFLIDVFRVDLTFCANPRGQAKSEVAGTAADIRNAMSGLNCQGVKHLAGRCQASRLRSRSDSCHELLIAKAVETDALLTPIKTKSAQTTL
ncbi:MAG: hypothetical protein WAV20_25425 [Blastocatellia bacterium]